MLFFSQNSSSVSNFVAKQQITGLCLIQRANFLQKDVFKVDEPLKHLFFIEL